MSTYDLPVPVMCHNKKDDHTSFDTVCFNNTVFDIDQLFETPELLIKLGTYARSVQSISDQTPIFISSNWWRINRQNYLEGTGHISYPPLELASLLFHSMEYFTDMRTVSWFKERRRPLNNQVCIGLENYLESKHFSYSKYLERECDKLNSIFDGLQSTDLKELQFESILFGGTKVNNVITSNDKMSRILELTSRYNIVVDKIIFNHWAKKNNLQDLYVWHSFPIKEDSSFGIAEVASLNRSLVELNEFMKSYRY